jgi:hypothetical protein
MYKKVLLGFSFVYNILLSCNDMNGKKREVYYSGDTTAGKIVKMDTARRIAIANDTSQKAVGKDNTGNRILGIWAAVGDENASFIIEKNKITYPDQNASFKYFLLKDSIKIKFDGFDGNYLVKTRGADTLVLAGDEEQVFCRFKK